MTDSIVKPEQNTESPSCVIRAGPLFPNPDLLHKNVYSCIEYHPIVTFTDVSPLLNVYLK